MPLTIALHGLSCSGKTTVSKLLAARYPEAIVRHCGELLKERARAVGISIDQIATDVTENTRLDDETRSIVIRNRGILIVEGRFLAEVLNGLEDVLLIELRRTEQTATQRNKARASSGRPAPSEPKGGTLEDMTTSKTSAISWLDNSHASIITDDLLPQEIVQTIVTAIETRTK